MTRIPRASSWGVLALSLAAPAFAGPDWKEGFITGLDAGPLPSSAEIPFNGNPFPFPLETIAGRLDGFGLVGPGDFQDMYAIYIEDFVNFKATTVAGELPDAFTTFDSQLFLFDSAGVGVGASDGAGPGATLTIPTLIQPSLTPGVFYLAISGFDSDPVDAANALLFPNVTGVVVAPINFNPIADWTTGAVGGDYVIALAEAFFIPSPGALALLLLAAPRHRRAR
jgi:hypothetical protein